MKGQSLIRAFIFLIPIGLFGYFFFQAYNSNLDFQNINQKNSAFGNMFANPIQGPIRDGLSLIGIADQWLYFPAVLYLLVIPYVAIALITYGFLSEINIFQNSPGVNGWLALIIGFSLVPFGNMIKATTAMLATIGTYGTLAFGVIFFLGVGWMVFQRMETTGMVGKGQGTYRGFGQREQYTEMRNWLERAVDANTGKGPIVDPILREMTRADKDFADGKLDQAVNRMRQAARKASSTTNFTRPTGRRPF